MAKLPKVLARPKPANAKTKSAPPYESSTYMDEKMRGIIRKPDTAKKVALKGANTAASPGANKLMPKGGNTASNKSGAYPGV